jgi:diguanylate cyclase (GGDEF)-like protein/PAS domain S-box-containing protein
MTNRILLASELAVSMAALQERLQVLGYQVAGCAASLEEITLMVRDLHPELILIELQNSPSFKNAEAAGCLLLLSDIPIIYLADHFDPAMVNAVSLTNSGDFLLQPCGDEELHVCLQSALIRMRNNLELRKSVDRYTLAARSASMGVWDWNLKTGEIYFSTGWKSLLGYSEDEFENTIAAWLERIHPDDRVKMKNDLNALSLGTQQQFDREYRIQNNKVTYVWMACTGIVERDPQGAAYRIVGSQIDITTRKLHEEQLAYDALHDALTGLPNRVLFMDRLNYRLERTKRHPEHLFAVLFLDLDRFKVVNDSLGHNAGDQLLITTAIRIQQCLRPDDTVSRISGDEFAILINEISDVNHAVRICDRIRGRLVTTTLLGSVERSPTASIGIALFHNNYEKPEEMLRDADLAMYRAKSKGRNRHQIFDAAMYAGAVALLQMEAELKRAVARQEWQVLYQPIISLENSETIGVEALLRWQHPVRGTVYPLEFIHVAEDTGFIVPIGQYVLFNACKQVKAWRDAGKSKLWVAVNISARQFRDDGLVDMVRQALEESGLPSDGLRLEITESVAMHDLEHSIKVLSELDKLGVYASLDDFGTGYSSLSYLKRFPLKVLKIDQSFIQDIQYNKNSEAITLAVIAMARSLNLEVVAEGVEKIEQLDFLRQMFCDHVQGFYLSHPLSVKEFGNTIR